MIDSPTTSRNLMFEHSRVVETGPFDELLQAGGPSPNSPSRSIFPLEPPASPRQAEFTRRSKRYEQCNRLCRTIDTPALQPPFRLPKIYRTPSAATDNAASIMAKCIENRVRIRRIIKGAAGWIRIANHANKTMVPAEISKTFLVAADPARRPPV
jgi:hypothetical protein